MKFHIIFIFLFFQFSIWTQSCPDNCYDDYQHCLSYGSIPTYIQTTSGTTNYINFLKKYYPTLVDNEEKSGKSLDKATYKDCIFLRLFWRTDPEIPNRGTIGRIIYGDWRKKQGDANITTPSVDEFNAWKKETKNDDKQIKSYTIEDWQKLIDNGQISGKGKLISVDGELVMMYKYKYDGETAKRTEFEDTDITEDGKINLDNVIDNLKNNSFIYKYYSTPFIVENDEKYDLGSTIFKFILKVGLENKEYIAFEEEKSVGIKMPQINSESINSSDKLISDFTEFEGEIVSSKLLSIINQKYLYNYTLFTGCAVDFFDNGQIKSKKQIKNGEINGKIEIYFLDEKYNSKDFFDSNYCESLKSELNESFKSLNTSIQDSILKSNQLKDYLFNSIKGYEKLAKLRTKYLNNTLKGKKFRANAFKIPKF
jgi:hypothetical protein